MDTNTNKDVTIHQPPSSHAVSFTLNHFFPPRALGSDTFKIPPTEGLEGLRGIILQVCSRSRHEDKIMMCGDTPKLVECLV